ncbi:MAG: DUF3536 domain-containing protein [Acidimicrobiales bacterium]|nr:DUF3536 domain-containing protein [Acidimicrobiales bacterium]
MTDAPVSLVIHGHFYQPPREDPWTGEVPVEESAAPFHDWNERITDECYRPNVFGPVNTFELLSFNVGPTLLSWLESHHPDVYDGIRAADRATGRAIAQGYGHAILPLCNERDLRTHVRWGVADFEHRFGRRPEGMWLPETAVNEAVLEVLAEEGLRFTILAPHQIAEIRPRGSEHAWTEAGLAERTPTDRPLRWRHTGHDHLELDLVVYDGSMAHSLAFGAPTAGAIVDAAVGQAGEGGGLVCAATDGETFGHHHRGAEREVGEALTGEAQRRGVQVPRLVDLLDERPATHEARVRVSAWSCSHGVDRWWSHCGCRTGGEQGWDQTWREPLRNALDLLREWGVEVVDRRGPAVLHDAWAARDAYVDVLIGRRSYDDFADEHVLGDPHHARLLLEAQRHALLMYTSCGWFFNDLGGLETVQILRYAARAMDLYAELGESPPLDALLDVLARARSNDPDLGDGRQIWKTRVIRTRQ